MMTHRIEQYFHLPYQYWKRPDDNSEEFPKYVDGYPEDLICNEVDKKQLEKLSKDKMQKTINEIKDQRSDLFSSYLREKCWWYKGRIPKI